MFIFNLFRSFLRNNGFDIIKYSNSPYEFLLSKRRYKDIDLILDEKIFKISDSLSFYYSYIEIFKKELYKFKSKKKSPFILDLGSNHGLSIIFFKKIFPEARIVGVEADPKIFEKLFFNIKNRNYKNVQLINKAVSEKGKYVIFSQEGADGGRIHPINKNIRKIKIETINIDNIINEKIDFLKIDIEGKEIDVVCNSKKLNLVEKIFIEYHSFVDCQQNLENLLKKLKNSGFRYYIQTQFCSPKPFIKINSSLNMDLQLNIFAIKK